MAANYLKKYYLQDHKLAQRARLEFYRALSTGRMIAFTGSMATQAFGYGGWEQLRMTFSAIAGDAARAVKDAEMQARIKLFEKRSVARTWTVPVGMNLIEEALDQYKGPPPTGWPPKSGAKHNRAWPLDQFDSLGEAMRVELARRFREPREHWRADRGALDAAQFNAEFNVPLALWEALGIRRFATPSYDFELERVMMLADEKHAGSPFDKLVELRGSPNENFYWDLGSGRIRRVFSDGWAIESDLLNRERIDRMIEFAVGTDDVDGHVMHLHGRACNWRTMIASQRDYDNQYRRNDLNRAPFEFAKRLMMGGNPILFVGLGMSEAELNHELQEFISNNPYQRVAPTFLLWSARASKVVMTPEEIAAMRINHLRRLGVLTILDTDFGPVEPHKGKYEPVSERYGPVSDDFATSICISQLDQPSAFDEADASTREDLRDLKTCVDRIALGVSERPGPTINPTVREAQIGTRWRSMAGRIDAATSISQPVVLWEVQDSGLAVDWLPELIDRASTSHMLCIIGPQGCGRGTACRALSNTPPDLIGLRNSGQCMVINGGFSFDTDTILEGVARFFATTFSEALTESDEGPPRHSRSVFFENLFLYDAPEQDGARALVIMNGMERFFDVAGNPLSAELDELLAHARGPRDKEIKRPAPEAEPHPLPRARWVFFGTERVRQYMTEIGAEIVEFSDLAGFPPDPLADPDDPHVPARYLDSVWQRMKSHGSAMPAPLRQEILRYEANRTGRISGDSIELRRAMFGTLFDEFNLKDMLEIHARGAIDVHTARDILKALAFIGMPIERDVLELMPDLRSPKPRTGAASTVRPAAFGTTLDALVKANLVLKLQGYQGPDSIPKSSISRFALHRSLLTELRYRYGIPLSEAKLSTAFNMSLYVAQPIDGDIPDTDIHDELGEAIDGLIGSYNYPDAPTSLAIRAGKLGLNRDAYDKILRTVADACGASRAPAIDQDFLEIERLCSDRHARALRAALALVRGYYSTTGLLTLDSGDRLIREGRDGVLLEHAERLDDLIDGYGKMSLAREKLRHELTAQSILGVKGKKAREVARKASMLLFNEQFGNTEPFYPDDLVWLHNERGVVRLGMGDLYEARRSFDQALLINRKWVEREDRAHNWRRIRLNQLTVDIEMGEISLAERKCEELIRFSKGGFTLREDRLAIAIAVGYQGWCYHLRGKADRARERYEQACKALSELGEVRAQAYFERLCANALRSMNEPVEQRKCLERALDLAQSAVQMDIVHRLQVTLADCYLFGPEPRSAEKVHWAHRYLEEALTYALHTDVHRVRCEASMVTARARLGISDFDGALRYATDAMMVATRYGLELRKISLRALIARVMAARGHPVTAEHLARTCIKMATRQRYQTAIEEAAQVILEIPRISAAISTSDKSGRRNF